MKFLQKIMLALGLVTLVPVATLGAKIYEPEDTKVVVLEEIGNQRYEVSVQVHEGDLFRFDEVRYTDSRYQLFEDTAKVINDHRRFTSFDDDDIVVLVYGDVPFEKGDVKSARAQFDDTRMLVTVEYWSGDGFVIDKTLDNKFTHPREVATLIKDEMNKQSGFLSSFTEEDIYELIPTFENIEYYAPDVSRIEAKYNVDDEDIDVKVYFVNGETREFKTTLKPTKQQVAEDIALLITELYTDREGGVLLRSDVSDKIAWVDLPRTIDDIELITVSLKDEETMLIEVRSILDSGTRAFTLFEAPYTDTLDNIEAVTIVVADTLETSPVFAPDFNIDDLSRRIETGDIEQSRYTGSEVDVTQTPLSDNEDADEEKTEEVDDSEEQSSDTGTESLYEDDQVGLSTGEEDAEVASEGGEEVSEQNSSNRLSQEEEEAYLALLQLIILYIQLNDIDIDLSQFL